MGNWDNLSLTEKAAMMRVAVKNGITNLQDIKREYNEFAGGGPKKKSASGWYQQHQNRWYNFLKNKGLSDADSARLSGFFTAQDDLESAGGKSNAAREKNNFGGMQRGGKNIKYNTVEDYMQDKWKMMNSKFKSALGAKNIDEYATILGNPETAGKGYLYYVTDKVKYDPRSPQWKAAQRQHMQNYINGMRSRAGMGTVRFNNQPIASAKSPITPIVPIQSQDSSVYAESSIPFTPFNPEAFFATPETYQQPIVVEEPEVQEPVTISPYSPEEIERQERMNRLSAFNRILSLTNPYPQEEDSFLSTIGLLTGNTFSKGGGIHIKPSHRGRLTELKKRTGKSEAELYKTGGPAVRKMITFARNARKWKHGLGGNLFDGDTEDSQQMVNPYKPNGGFYYVDSEGQPVNPTTKNTIELPDIVVAANSNSPAWYNRTAVGDWNEDGSKSTWEGIQPLVMSSSEWNRSHSANDLQTIDPYGEIPWNAAAVATGFLAPQLASSYITKGAELPFEAVDRGKRFLWDIGDRYQGMKDAAAYRSANGNMDARTIANLQWLQRGGTSSNINRMGISNNGDFGIHYLDNTKIGHYFSPKIEKGGNMTLTTHLGGEFSGDYTKNVLPMKKSEKVSLIKYIKGIPEHTYFGEAGRTKNYAEQYFNEKPSRMKAFWDSLRDKKEINEPYWNEKGHIKAFMNEEDPTEKVFQKHLYEANEPISTDSYKLILQQAAKDDGRFALRYDSSPMGLFNPQGVYENNFYESLLSLSPEEKVNTINKWIKGWNPKARLSYLNNGEVLIPRPLLKLKSNQ